MERVVVLGTGQMGSAIIRNVIRAPDLTLAGVWARRRRRAGMDAGQAAGLSDPIGIAVESDLVALVERVRPDVAIQATCSTLEDAAPEVEACVERGVDVVSIAEELVWPAAYSREWAHEIDALAVSRGATVMGTGVNPGFVMDLLAVTLMNVSVEVDSIFVRRTNDLSPYGPTVLHSQGVGLTPDAFRAALESGEVVGHVGFPASLALIATALDWEIDRVEETRQPIVSTVPRRTPFVEVAPGDVAGCLHEAIGYRDGRPVITLVHPQQVDPNAEGIQTEDLIEIRGEPDLKLVIRPEIPGGTATAALAVNLVGRVAAAPAGLTSMIDLPMARSRALPAEPIPAGTRVELHRTVLPPGDRAPDLPEETRGVPLEQRVSGVLVEEAVLGQTATIITPAGRSHRGTVVAVDPPYDHGFGTPVPELSRVGAELRDLLGREGSS